MHTSGQLSASYVKCDVGGCGHLLVLLLLSLSLPSLPPPSLFWPRPVPSDVLSRVCDSTGELYVFSVCVVLGGWCDNRCKRE